MGGKIEVYLDCNSPYSYFAFKYLLKNRELLEGYDVKIDINPIFLGGINNLSGNKPPWTLPAKEKYGKYDFKRSKEYFGIMENFTSPKFFPISSLLPMRSFLVVKSKYSAEKFEKLFIKTWEYTFIKHLDISKKENLKLLLTEDKEYGLTDDEAEEVLRLAGTKEVKDKLSEQTKWLVEERGAFGAPWFWITPDNDKSKGEPVFGSDRWSYIWKLLNVPAQELRIIDKNEKTNQSKL